MRRDAMVRGHLIGNPCWDCSSVEKASKPKRTQVAPAVTQSQQITLSANRQKVSTASSFINPDNDNQINRENILFVYLDLHSQLLPQMLHSLRALNDHVQTFDSDSLCFDFLQTSYDRVFFICPTSDKDLVKAVHELSAVEAIFLLATDTQLDRGRLPKIDGIYGNFEELLVGLRCTLEWFEQTQMEVFAVERDRMFLWSQLWKEEVRWLAIEQSSWELCLSLVSEANVSARGVDQRDAGECGGTSLPRKCKGASIDRWVQSVIQSKWCIAVEFPLGVSLAIPASCSSMPGHRTTGSMPISAQRHLSRLTSTESAEDRSAIVPRNETDGWTSRSSGGS